LDKSSIGGNYLKSGEDCTMNDPIVIDIFFIVMWGLVLTSVIMLFVSLRQFHRTNHYFPNLYTKEDRKKIISIIKFSEILQERRLAKKILIVFYLMNLFIVLPIIVEVYLFYK